MAFAPKVDFGGRDVVHALVISQMVVVTDEGFDLGFEIARQEVVLQQDAVLQSLVPALDLLRVLKHPQFALNVAFFVRHGNFLHP